MKSIQRQVNWTNNRRKEIKGKHDSSYVSAMSGKIKKTNKNNDTITQEKHTKRLSIYI